jgi:hypothetical protein
MVATKEEKEAILFLNANFCPINFRLSLDRRFSVFIRSTNLLFSIFSNISLDSLLSTGI